jgi:hypothetical protein
MKKLIALVVIALCATGSVFSQDDLTLSISGEVKTGVFSYWTETEDPSAENGVFTDEGAFIHNSEDDNWMAIRGNSTGMADLRGQEGLYRLNFLIEKGNIGAKVRFQTTSWRGGAGAAGAASWGYAFLYGDFFADQLKISVGKMGDSPWGTDERELLKEVDTPIGMRFEYKPFFAPGLNVGFVLNNWNTSPREDAGLTDLLAETVFGLSYTHDYFHLRLAYRLDSAADEDGYYTTPTDQGGRLVYRAEERIIQNYLPGFQIWSVGYFEELGSGEEDLLTGTSLFYVQYDPDDFTAQLRLGYNIVNLQLMGRYEEGSRQYFSVRPSFYYKLFGNFLRVGVAGEFAKDFGGNKVVPASYLYWYVEPEIRLNLGSGTYLALMYRYQDDYHQLDRENPTDDYAPVNSKTHWVNLRAVFTF